MHDNDKKLRPSEPVTYFSLAARRHRRKWFRLGLLQFLLFLILTSSFYGFYSFFFKKTQKAFIGHPIRSTQIEGNNILIEKRLTGIYKEFDEMLRNPSMHSEKSKRYIQSAFRVREAYNGVLGCFNAIDSVLNTNYTYHQQPDEKAKSEKLSDLMTGSDWGKELYVSIQRFKRGLPYQIYEDYTMSKADNILEQLPINNKNGLLNTNESNPENWINNNFGHDNRENAYLTLQGMKNEVLVSVTLIAENCQRQIGNVGLYNEPVPEIAFNKTVLSVGENLRISINLKNFEAGMQPKIWIDGQSAAINSSGKVIYSRKASEPGVKKLKVEIKYKNADGVDVTNAQHYTYSVLKSHPPKRESVTMASMGYAYPKKIFRGQVRNINVFVSVSDSSSEIEDTLKRLNIQQEVVEGNDTITTEVTSIAFCKSITVSLIDPQDIWKIKPVHNTDSQTIDLKNGNRWRWTISTDTDKQLALLIIKASARQPDCTFKEKNIQIRVEINNNGFFRKIYIFLQDNPESLLTLILIPIFIYIFKKIFGKKEKPTPY